MTTLRQRMLKDLQSRHNSPTTIRLYLHSAAEVEKEVTTRTRMSVVQMCGVAGFPRCGYYRFLDPVKPAPDGLAEILRDRDPEDRVGVALL